MKHEIINLIDSYWKFDDAQTPVSTWHDKQDLLEAVRKVYSSVTEPNVGNIKYQHSTDSFEKLTVEKAKAEVEQIKKFSDVGDYANAHGIEDSLHIWFIESVAQGVYHIDEAVQVSNIVKQTNDLDFERWVE